MIRHEIKNLLSRRGIVMLLLAALAFNLLLVIQNADTRYPDGYTTAELDAAYAALPSDPDQILPWIEEASESFDIGYSDRLMYAALYERVSDVVNYQDDLQTRLDEAQLKLNSPFFAKPDTFDYRNLLLLLETYEPLTRQDIQPVPESSLGIELATGTRLTDAVLVFIALTLSFGLIVLPKDEGLFALLKPMKHGREKMLAAKYITLLLLLFLAAFLLYGTNLLTSHLIYGLGDLSRPVQSINGFSTCRYVLSVSQYLTLFVLHKFFWAAGIGSVFLCISIFVRGIFALCSGVLILLALNLLGYVSSTPWLQMTNLIWTSDTQWYFSGYYNLSLRGYPVDAFLVALIVQLLLPVAAYAAAHVHFKRQENVVTETSARQRKRLIPLHSNLMLHEGYKLFIRQRAALILLLFLIFQGYNCYSQYYDTDIYDRYYAEKLSGPVSAAHAEFIRTENEMFDDIYAELEQYSTQLMNGNISEETFDILTRELNTQLLAEPAFRRAESQYAQIEALNAAGQDAVYVELQVYDHILGDAAERDNMLNAIKLAFVIALGLSALFASEHSTHMDQLLAIMPRRRAVSWYKLLWAFLFAVPAALIAFVPKIISVGIKLGYSHFDAQISSLLFLAPVFPGLSIRGYLLITGGLWILSSCAGATATIFISDRSHSRALSALAAFLVLMIPVLLLL